MQAGERATADLYVRSLVAAGNGSIVETALSTLADVAESGAIDGHEIHVWGDCVPPAGPVAETDPARAVLSTVEEMETWAAAADAELLGFDDRTVGSLVEQSRQVLSLPAAALVERRGGTIERVSPHVCDGTALTVEDHLEALGDDPAEETPPDPVLTG